MSGTERDEISGTTLTGHQWDGIGELDSPTPRWWLWTFYATIVWAIGYSIAYPAWPLITTNTQGLLGYSSRANLARDIAEARASQSELLARIEAASLDEIVADSALLQFANAGGAAAFKVNCVQCHGSGAAGGRGYPNLNDDDWLWGGSLEAIHGTIRNGVRFALDPETRDSLMPAFADGILDAGQIDAVTAFVLKLSGQEHDVEAAAKGEAVFATNCADCHGAQGEGKREFGSPRLIDAIWLHGADAAAIATQIGRPRHGVMPAWSQRLDPVTLKQLAVFVHSLGGGEATAP